MDPGGDREAGVPGSCLAEPGPGGGDGEKDGCVSSLGVEKQPDRNPEPLGLSGSSPAVGCQSQEAQPM